MPRGLRRFLQFLLTLVTTLAAILMFLLGHGKGSELGAPCGADQACRPQLVCGTPMGLPYCTRPCDLAGPDDCPQGFACWQWTPALPKDGVCRKK